MSANNGFKCPVPECPERVPIRGHFCSTHWHERKAKAYYAPDFGPFTCVIPTCGLEVPHRETMCAKHWEKVNRKRQWQIVNFSSLFHVLLGLAIDEVVKQEKPPDLT